MRHTNTQIHHIPALAGFQKLEDNSVQSIVTSPPYWGLRDYEGNKEQIGQEAHYQDYLDNLLEIFAEAYRVLDKKGTCFVNLGDTYGGSGNGVGSINPKKRYQSNTAKQGNLKGHLRKSKLLIPERFAIGMVDMGWTLRNDIIWHKPNAQPESVKDRFTNDFENIYFFVKSKQYTFNQLFEPIQESTKARVKRPRSKKDAKSHSGQYRYSNPDTYGTLEFLEKGRNMRTLWSMPTKGYKEAHFAVFPDTLPERCIMAGSNQGDLILDPFMGSGTTAEVAQRLGRDFMGFEVEKKYIKLAEKRIQQGLKGVEDEALSIEEKIKNLEERIKALM